MTGTTTILLTGADGQLGRSLKDTTPGGVRLISLDREMLDITSAAAVQKAMQEHQPDIVINAAAFTAVDRAEDESEAAHQINGDAVAELARSCRDHDSRLIQISTDFVFPGDGSKPLSPADPTGPGSVYGRSKLAGEQAALEAGDIARVFRTSWVYSEHGHNFVKTMLRLGNSHDELRVVDDQIGSPTYARNLALAVWALADRWPDAHVLHYADAGNCSWFDFAREIFNTAQAIGLLNKVPDISPVSTAEYGAPAPRPAYSVLNTYLTTELLGLQPPVWQTALGQMLSRLQTQNG
ncbi:MAG: dTDP-4-dehydrorhamnose reductase [Gammaproteobacteria bacterium]|nr:dTDP-4-dehydrorhamnose reductase [Gammaproteobacteria bacterium]NND54032.1 dTDP-4-dehydrorhamnose reductase [Gammaproteobacteria bacterium]